MWPSKYKNYVKTLRQPFKFLTHCTVCGFMIATFCLIAGIILLVFFSSGLTSDEDKKRIPAWIGLVVFLLGLVCLLMGISLVVILVRLFKRQERIHTQRQAISGQPGTSLAPSPNKSQTYQPVASSSNIEIDVIVPHDQRL